MAKKIKRYFNKKKGIARWITDFLKGTRVTWVNYMMAAPLTGAWRRCRRSPFRASFGLAAAVHCACQHVIVSGPLPISVISTPNKKGKKKYRKPSCKNKILRALMVGKSC